ncbi:MAG: integrase arm-type DNA-binding domain-containing protein [Parasphingorhabdus sp.]|uniref:tyrosine-type recombinase/integrase n=1 Tax=Parasphingorhabdus sp. TaxID=2709688 RepID=UPI003002FE6A
MALSVVAIKAAKGRSKQYKLADSGGLHLLVMPNGQRYWRMNYRYLGKHKTIAIGVWPDVALADARAKRDEARRVLADGIDPAEKAKLDKIAASVAAANTFQSVAEEWIAKIEQEGRAAVTLKKIRWLLSFTYPALGKRPIADISPHELLAVLRKVEMRGRHESAKRIRATCSQVFRYAIATARADRDVANDLKGALIVPKVTHRPAITTPMEAGALLRAIDGFDGHPITLSALKLLPHVFVRPGVDM